MEYTLAVGESVAIRRNVLTSTWGVVYAGMPAEDRYSIVVTWACGYHATSYNLYLTDSVREVPFKGGRLRMLELTPSQIRFRYVRS